MLDDPTKLTPGDRRGVRWSEDLRAHWLDQVAKAVTHLGSLPVAGGLIVVVAAFLLLAAARSSRPSRSLGGIALTIGGVQLTKALVDRPRPPHPLTDAVGSAYPSGHAAYAVAWIAVAVALRRVVPGLAGTAAALVAGIAIAVAIGLTRIYLQRALVLRRGRGPGTRRHVLQPDGPRRAGRRLPASQSS